MSVGPWARIDATRRFAAVSQLVRIVLAWAALACLISPVVYARATIGDFGGFYLGVTCDRPSRADDSPARTTSDLTFLQVVDRDPDEAWQFTIPLAIMLLVAWEVVAHRRARRSVPPRAPAGHVARLVLLLVWLMFVAVATFELFRFGEWRSAAGETTLGLAWLVAVAGAIVDILIARRIARYLRMFDPVPLPEARVRRRP